MGNSNTSPNGINAENIYSEGVATCSPLLTTQFPNEAGCDSADVTRRHSKRKRKAQLLQARVKGRGEGCRPLLLSMCPQSPKHIHRYRGHHVHQVALSHWGILLWGPLGSVLPATLRQITHQLVLEKRKGVRTFITSLLREVPQA